jgi:hypothetical protein
MCIFFSTSVIKLKGTDVLELLRYVHISLLDVFHHSLSLRNSVIKNM